ncbi:hypothetical protein F4776DRAFT_297918 [Hypoxylon sp. NC0597]|nr:hypothetical protein F4776DRAFT_297918 [Hypoxylon sp. NC0597]
MDPDPNHNQNPNPDPNPDSASEEFDPDDSIEDDGEEAEEYMVVTDVIELVADDESDSDYDMDDGEGEVTDANSEEMAEAAEAAGSGEDDGSDEDDGSGEEDGSSEGEEPEEGSPEGLLHLLLRGAQGLPEEERQEFIRSLDGRFAPWYRLPNQNPDDSFEMYEPEGRFIRIPQNPHLLDLDWYHRNGIPHEILTPMPNQFDAEGRQKKVWLPFKMWMRRVARAWWKAPAQDPLNPELFDGIYDRGNINFFRVMKSRIARQRQCAFYMRLLSIAQDAAFGKGESLDVATRFEFRRQVIIFSLMGLDNDNILSEGLKMQELLRFIISPAVRGAFIEYYQNWLQHNPDTRNPRWNLIQSAFADRSLAAVQRRRRTYGVGRLRERRPVNKDGWIHEDHAMRFLTTLHYIGRAQMIRNNIESGDANNGWRRYMFSNYVYVDFEDKYWFGYALLNLLIKSWQFNRVHPHPRYEAVLVPVLYEDFQPAEITFPKLDVGFIDLSPSSPWTTSDVNYAPTIDFATSNSLGLTTPDIVTLLWEAESETELDEDGGPLPNAPEAKLDEEEAVEDPRGPPVRAAKKSMIKKGHIPNPTKGIQKG